MLSESFDHIASTLAHLRTELTADTIHVTTTPSFAAKWLVPRLNDWYAQSAACRIHLLPSLDYLPLQQGSNDFAIRCGVPPWNDCEHELLMPIHLVPVCSPGYAAASALVANPSDTLEHNLIHADIGEQEPGQEWRDWLQRKRSRLPGQARRAFGQGPGSSIAPPCIARIMAQEVPANPHFAFIRSPVWEQVEPVTKDAFRELIEATNEAQPGTIDIVDMPASFAALHEDHRKVMEGDLARSFAAEYQRGKTQLSDVLRDMIERGQQVSDTDYQQALAHMQDYNDFLGEVFEDYDAILTPATPGPAPAGIDATGSPVMNTIWTFCGTPAINLPILQSPDGLPMGVQVVGERNDDARLFRSTRWLLDVLQNDSLDASDN